MIESQYSIKDQGYILLATCDECSLSDMDILTSWEIRNEDKTMVEHVQSVFPGWTIRDEKLFCPVCIERAYAKSTP
jgi:hypothetical protein